MNSAAKHNGVRWPGARLSTALAGCLNSQQWVEQLSQSLAPGIPGCRIVLETSFRPDHSIPNSGTAATRLTFDLLDETQTGLGKLHINLPRGYRNATVKHTLGQGMPALLTQLCILLSLERYRTHAALADLMLDLSYILLFEENMDVLLHSVVHYLHDRFSLSLTTLCLVENRQLVLKAHVGESLFPLQEGMNWPESRGLTGRTLQLEQAVYEPEVSNAAGYLPGNSLTQAELVMPIKHHGAMLGVINMESSAAGSFSPEVRQVLDILADQIGGVLHLHLTSTRLREANLRSAQLVSELDHLNHKLTQANHQLERLSNEDALTGAENRRGFDRALTKHWEYAERHQRYLALLMIDIDNFKAYNDLYGHQAGDACLSRIGEKIRTLLRGKDAVFARYGGEEFTVILPNANGEGAMDVAQRLRREVLRAKLTHAGSGVSRYLTISIGVATCHPGGRCSAVKLISAADHALYQAKRAGRNNCKEQNLQPAATTENL